MIQLLAASPFFTSWFQSDLLGKGIYVALYFLSVLSWSLLIYKGWIFFIAKKNSEHFNLFFKNQRKEWLHIDYDTVRRVREVNPFYSLYRLLQSEIGKRGEKTPPSPAEIESIHAFLMTGVASETKRLEKNLFILSTTVSLAPFLGLLGTVWGILTTFSDLSLLSHGSQETMLSGLSLALCTTVIGLIDAIPALVGYSILKNKALDFELEMERFSQEMVLRIGRAPC